jgi:hypothetical protein
MNLRCVSVIALVVASACNDKKTSTPSAPAPTQVAATMDARADSMDVKIKTFWTWFAQNAAALRADDNLERTMTRINEQLEPATPGVFGEIGRDGDKRTLVLTADGAKDLFPLVQQIYAGRPTVEGWTIVAFRPRGTAAEMLQLGRTEMGLGRLKFVASRDGSKLDVRVFIPKYDGSEDMQKVAYLVLDHTIGEYDMETKIGVIEFDSIDHAPRAAKPLADLPAAVDAIN